MGLEQRDAGRWRRDGASRGKRTGDSVGDDSTSRKSAAPGGGTSPLGLGGTDGLDGTDADGPGNRVEGRQVVQAD